MAYQGLGTATTKEPTAAAPTPAASSGYRGLGPAVKAPAVAAPATAPAGSGNTLNLKLPATAKVIENAAPKKEIVEPEIRTVKPVDTSKTFKRTLSVAEKKAIDKGEVISAPLASTIAAPKTMWEKVKGIFSDDEKLNDTAKTIRDQEQARTDIRKDELKNINKDSTVVGSVKTGLQSGLLGTVSAVKSAGSVIARKSGATEIAKKLDISASKDKELKKFFDQRYREGIVSDKYSAKEKVKSAPVRYVAGLVSEALPASLGILGAGAAASVAGAPTAAATGIATGVGALIQFGSSYQDAREFGLDEKQAENVAFKIAVTTAPLEFIPEFRLLAKIPQGKMIQDTIKKDFTKNLTTLVAKEAKSFAIQGGLESGTEIPQTVIENAWKKTYDENQDLFEGVQEAGLAAFFSGGIMDSLVSVSSDLHASVASRMQEHVVDEPEFDIANDPESAAVLKEEIADSIASNGQNATVQALKEQLGIPVDQAEKLIVEASKPDIEGDAKGRQEILDILAEEEVDGVGYKGIKEENAAIQEDKNIVENEAKIVKEDATAVVAADKKASVTELSSALENSLEKNANGVREKSLEYYKANPEKITESPVRLREVDGKVVIEDGRHRLEAARAAGIKELAIEDVTSQYPEKEGEVGQSSKMIESMTSKNEAVVDKIIKNSSKSDDFKSRVYDRLKAEHPNELTDDLSYEAINLKKDSDKAVDLIEQDPDKAFRIAMNAESSPDVTSTSVNIAMAQKALDKGNKKLYAQLTKNRSLAQTRRGQEIVAEKGSVSDNSTSRYVKELISNRLEKLADNYVLNAVKSKKLSGSKKERAIKFLDEEVKKVQKSIKSAKEIDLAEAQAIIDSLAC